MKNANTRNYHDNHGVRSENWRYIRYADGSEELYDHDTDPNEWKNLAAGKIDATIAKVMAEHRNWLPKTEVKQVRDLKKAKPKSKQKAGQ